MGVSPVCDVNRHIWPRDADAQERTSFRYCAHPRVACRAGVRRARPGGGAAARADGYTAARNRCAYCGATHADRSATHADRSAAHAHHGAACTHRSAARAHRGATHP